MKSYCHFTLVISVENLFCASKINVVIWFSSVYEQSFYSRMNFQKKKNSFSEKYFPVIDTE